MADVAKLGDGRHGLCSLREIVLFGSLLFAANELAAKVGFGTKRTSHADDVAAAFVDGLVHGFVGSEAARDGQLGRLEVGTELLGKLNEECLTVNCSQ